MNIHFTDAEMGRNFIVTGPPFSPVPEGKVLAVGTGDDRGEFDVLGHHDGVLRLRDTPRTGDPGPPLTAEHHLGVPRGHDHGHGGYSSKRTSMSTEWMALEPLR